MSIPKPQLSNSPATPATPLHSPPELGNGKKTQESPEPPQASDLMVKVLLEAHPKIQSPVRAEQEAIEAIKREAPQCGGMKEAYRYLLVRTRLYKTMTDKWPAEEKNFIVGAPKFFKECVYRLDEKEWVKHDAKSPPMASNMPCVDEILKQQREGTYGK